VDAVSWPVLLEDLETACAQLDRDEPVRLPKKTTSFKRWAEGLAARARSEEVRAEARLWLEEVEGEVQSLPGRLPGDSRAGSARLVSAALEEETTRRLLREVPQALDAEITEVLLGALGVALLRDGSAGSVLVDVERHGREPMGEDIDTSRTVGWFTTVFPLRLVAPRGGRGIEAVRAVKRRLRRLPGQGIGYGLLRYLGQDRTLTERLERAPAAEVSFNYLGQMDLTGGGSGRLHPAPESAGAWRSPRSRRRYRLEVVGWVSGGRLKVGWHYGEGVDGRETVEEWARGFLDALRSLVAGRRVRPVDHRVAVQDAELGAALGEVEFE
jgi:non-ribosomal peptide synthase protein (TIGR01720 family)